MERRNIQIDLDTAKKWYLSRDSFKQELALQVFSKEELENPKLPKSWEEYLKFIVYPTDSIYYKKDCMDNKLESLSELLILRDVYRQGWKPDWEDRNQIKYFIYFEESSYNIKYDWGYYVVHMFSFPTEELAKQFLENFKDELEQLKDIL